MPTAVCVSLFTESVSEITGLSTSLVRTDHIRVLPGKWKWQDNDQWPPISTVLATHFWQDDTYKEIREALREPIPNPDVVVGGEFITIDTWARTSATVSEPPAAEPPADLGTEPIIEEDVNAPIPKPTVQAPVEPRTAGSEPEEESKPKTGLLHLVGMKFGSYVPASLRDLSYSVVFVEATDDDSRGIHTLVGRIISNSEHVLVAVMGDVNSAADAVASIQKAYVREQLKVVMIRVYIPTNSNPPYAFDEMHLYLLYRLSLSMKVTFPSHCLFVDLNGGFFASV